MTMAILDPQTAATNWVEVDASPGLPADGI